MRSRPIEVGKSQDMHQGIMGKLRNWYWDLIEGGERSVVGVGVRGGQCVPLLGPWSQPQAQRPLWADV